MTQEAAPPAPPATAQPPAVAAPAVAPPATPAVVAPLEAPQAEVAAVGAEAKGTTFEYEKTGDVGLDYALGFIGKLGFGPERPAVVAALKGDFGLLKAELSALGTKAQGSAEVVALAEQAFARSAAEAANNEKDLQAFAIQAAGSAEQWNTVRQWAAAAADAKEKEAINASLAAGGVQAKMAMDYLVHCYNKSAGASKDPKGAVQAGAGKAGAAPSKGPLSAKAYADAVQALSVRLKGRGVDGHPEYVALQSQRALARRMGK